MARKVFFKNENQIREVPSIPPELKEQLWVSKEELTRARKDAQEEAMMDQVKIMAVSIIRNLHPHFSEKEVEESRKKVFEGGFDSIVLFLEEHGETFSVADTPKTGFENVSETHQSIRPKPRRSNESEAMFQQIQELVKQKLVQSDPSATYEQLDARLKVIMSLPNEKILSFLESSPPMPSANQGDAFNWVLDSSAYWKELPEDIRRAAQDLGYDETYWNESSQPAESDFPWDNLSLHQQKAASKLGYRKETWDLPGETTGVDPPMSAFDVQSQNREAEVADDGKDTISISTEEEEEDEFIKNFLSDDTASHAQSGKLAVHNHGDSRERSSKMREESYDIVLKENAGAVDPDEDEFMKNFLLDNDKTEKLQDKTDLAQTIEDDVDEEEFIKNFLSENDKPEKLQDNENLAKTTEDDVDEDEFIKNFLSDNDKTEKLQKTIEDDVDEEEFIKNFLSENDKPEKLQDNENLAKTTEDDVDEDEFIKNFLSDNDKTEKLQKTIEDDVDEEEFIKNFLSENDKPEKLQDREANLAKTAEDDVDEDEFIKNFLSDNDKPEKLQDDKNLAKTTEDDVDEDEFIKNFLSDDSGDPSSTVNAQVANSTKGIWISAS